MLTLQPATDQFYDPVIPGLLKYSKWRTITRVVSSCLRWKNKKKGEINPVEIWEAENAVVAMSQAQCYRATMVQLKLHGKVNHTNALAALAPFLDTRGHIPLGGRIHAAHLAYSAKYTLLLHAKDPLTTVLARHIHAQIEHTGGPRAIITGLKKKYRTPRSSTLFRSIAYGCVPCRKRLANPTKQIMAPLPYYRQPSARLHPFDHTAIDIAGPYETKIGRSMVKRWLLIFRFSMLGAVLI